MSRLFDGLGRASAYPPESDIKIWISASALISSAKPPTADAIEGSDFRPHLTQSDLARMEKKN
jgi:hypothetical protein